ncbi:MAG: hypothetical protein AAF430_14685 [Myxococcota bacterium]
MSWGRGEVWEWLGAPTDQVGSVNDPRTQLEFDETWNEKWIYRAGPDSEIRKVVLWFRYDLRGVFEPDGTRVPLPEEDAPSTAGGG